MTDTPDVQTRSRDLRAADPITANPWTIGLGVLAIAVTLIGLLLLLIPHTDEYGLAGDTDLIRLWAGAAITTVGGVATVGWLLLAGIGWQLKRAGAAGS